jgi:hypothetical protein
MKNVTFFTSLLVLNLVFSYTIQLCKSLQGEQKDIVEALNFSEDVRSELQKIRKDSEAEFKKLFSRVTSYSQHYDFNISKPRLCQKQTHRSNANAATPEDYYRVSIFIPYLDSVIQQLEERFINHKSILQGFMSLIPEDPRMALSDQQENSIKNLGKFYENDLSCSEDELISETRLWYRHLEKYSVKDMKNAMDRFVICSEKLLPNVHKLLQILLTLPVSTASNERSFSTLRRLKPYLRNSTSENRLNGLAVLNIHRNIVLSTDEILVELSRKPRRLKLIF